ncbi:hypothetical protein [Kribbella italica]|uniref:Uncharacterized protein n=1 Tax=Kribbella italica TaxID=1540520 RepID=A0A7W9J0G7_9ACTN|nr:hypothetical protein [Kribbella italica]MBB5833374.1 hypothetical protein [Kribbella italica]
MTQDDQPVPHTSTIVTFAWPRRGERPKPQQSRPSVIDIGAAITQPMLDEYREASEARDAGLTSPRLTFAFWACLVVIGGLILFGAVYGLLA